VAERRALASDTPAALAAWTRALVPGAGTVTDDVAAIVARVRDGGDAALEAAVREFDTPAGVEPLPIAVAEAELHDALASLEGEVRHGLGVAIENVHAVALAGVGSDQDVTLPQGHRVRLREIPVHRAAVYVPGGRAPYPSTVVMGVVTARAAGVEEVVVCAPGAHPVILAACALCGADRVYRMGGAHAVAALAYGTETIDRVDVIAGPGNLWVQEAKRQVSGDVGIDGFYGPSDVLVVATAGAKAALVAADLLAQAEHGTDSLAVCVSPDPALLDAIAPLVGGAIGPVALLDVPDTEAALAVAEAFAPEHLELQGEEGEALAPRVRNAGCVFVGDAGGTAFGDYVAGSNHSLPTGGAARYASGLTARAFRRRMSEVHIGDAATALAAAGVPIAGAEGFALHAASMEARVRLNQESR
jgi:histidinol dehydrogenase